MGTIILIIILLSIVMIGIKEFLIALAVGAVLGLISGIVQAVEQRRKNNYKQYYENQSHFKNKDQVDNNMIVIGMKGKEEQERDDFNLETDCECDWQDISNEDVSQSDWNDDDQIVNDMIVMEMMEEEQERDDFKMDSFNWETDCESCEELLEDCECDWQDISREDISQSDWNDGDSDNDGTSFDNFGG